MDHQCSRVPNRDYMVIVPKLLPVAHVNPTVACIYVAYFFHNVLLERLHDLWLKPKRLYYRAPNRKKLK